jgi:hypothetical protein
MDLRGVKVEKDRRDPAITRVSGWYLHGGKRVTVSTEMLAGERAGHALERLQEAADASPGRHLKL